jgi:hypothetical protein
MTSILGDIEYNLKEGDKLVDPFNVLDVKSLKFDLPLEPFIKFLDKNINENELLLFTEKCESSDWHNLLSSTINIIFSDEVKDKLIRFAWLICKILLYKNDYIEHLHPITINLNKFIDKSSNKNQLFAKIFINPLYIDLRDNFYKISINIENNFHSEIIFKNNINEINI